MAVRDAHVGRGMHQLRAEAASGQPRRTAPAVAERGDAACVRRAREAASRSPAGQARAGASSRAGRPNARAELPRCGRRQCRAPKRAAARDAADARAHSLGAACADAGPGATRAAAHDDTRTRVIRHGRRHGSRPGVRYSCDAVATGVFGWKRPPGSDGRNPPRAWASFPPPTVERAEQR
jgi:hypothetical protein